MNQQAYDDKQEQMKRIRMIELQQLANAVAPPDRETAIKGLTEIQVAVVESIRGDYDSRTLQKWVLNLVGETLEQLGAVALTPDEFDELFEGDSK